MVTLVDVDRHIRAILWLGIGRIPVLGHLDLAGLHLQDGVVILHGTRGLGLMVADLIDRGIRQLRAVISVRMEARLAGRGVVIRRIGAGIARHCAVAGRIAISLLVGGVIVIGLLRRPDLECDRIRHTILKLIAVHERDLHRLARNGNRVIALVEIDTITAFRCSHRHIIRAKVSTSELRVIRQRIGDGHVLVRRMLLDLPDDRVKRLVQAFLVRGAEIGTRRPLSEVTHLVRIGGHANREQCRIAALISFGNGGVEIPVGRVGAACTT